MINSFLARERLRFIQDRQFTGIANLHIGLHNAYGLVGNATSKLTCCLKFMQECDIDMLALVDTNLDEHTYQFDLVPDNFRTHYTITWVPKALNKGSGRDDKIMM